MSYDIYCPHCGEPHEHDLLHDVGGFDYDGAARLFKIMGCAMLDQQERVFVESRVCTAKPVNGQYSIETIKAAHEMSDYPDEWDYYLADLFASPEGEAIAEQVLSAFRITREVILDNGVTE